MQLLLRISPNYHTHELCSYYISQSSAYQQGHKESNYLLIKTL